MPASYLIDIPNRIVFSRAWGVLTDSEIIAHAETLKVDPRFNSGFRQVGDFLRTNALLLTSAAIRAVALDNPFPKDARRAFVVPSDEAFGLARMFSLYLGADPKEFAIFRELGPGLEWIGLPRSAMWPDRVPDKTF
jgi:hypothetical protein